LKINKIFFIGKRLVFWRFGIFHRLSKKLWSKECGFYNIIGDKKEEIYRIIIIILRRFREISLYKRPDIDK
jgi:hypothetical protein